MTIAPIVTLLHRRGPAAVHWPAFVDALIAVSARVIAVVVDAVDAMLRGWSLPHVAIKIQEVLKPAITYSNSPTTPISKSRMVNIKTSLLHSAPAGIFYGRTAHSVGCGVSIIALRFILEASATFGISAFETLAKPYCDISAITSTLPKRPVIAKSCELNNYQSEKTLSPDVFRSHRNLDKLRISHDVTPIWLRSG